MKLIIREYVASLKERNELDAILPDLLSEMGMVVYSRPGRGTRQDGVDVAAVGDLDGGGEKVYLFSIKAGDLTRKEWDGDSVQSLRPSLNEILDSYIPNRIPPEHRGKDVVICVTFGGDVQEQVRPQLVGFITQNAKKHVSFEEWNGDRLASLIQSHFLREDLLPEGARSDLRKSLALLDEPDASYGYFASLVKSLAKSFSNDGERVRSIRQLSICLWILFSWSRESANLESAYRSSELTLLHAWDIFRYFEGKDTKSKEACANAFASIFQAYRQINVEYLAKMGPHLQKLHALSAAVHSGSWLDVNLKMFDLLGRIAMAGSWNFGAALLCSEEEDAEQRNQLLSEVEKASVGLQALISNNPVLNSPIQDDQSTDVALAAFLFAISSDGRVFLRSWLREMVSRIKLAFATNERYPCMKSSYSELLEHPVRTESAYRESVTNASVLYPVLALFAALLEEDEIFEQLAVLQRTTLKHSNFQLWFPDDASEENLYNNGDLHGLSLSEISLQNGTQALLQQLSDECDHLPQLRQLSCVRHNRWQLVLVACRHYRLPVPVHFLKDFGEEPAAHAHGGGEKAD